MNTRTRQRRVARAVWAAGGRLEEVVERERVQLRTLQRWLVDPEFRTMLEEESLEPILQAVSAVMRWAPAAVARLIRDLDGESSSDARQAAREILRLALDAPRKIGRPPQRGDGGSEAADGSCASADDPLSRRIAGLSDEKVERIFAMLNEPEDREGEKP